MPIKTSPARFAGRLATTFAVITSGGVRWADAITSDALSLTGSFQTVQLDGEDMVIELMPNGLAIVSLDFGLDPTPTEFHEWRVLTSPDGTNWDTLPFFCSTVGNATGVEQRSFFIEGVRYFKVTAALMDTDGSPGGDDTATLTVYVRQEEQR